MNPLMLTDAYKTGHHQMYPKNTTLVYSNFTPRSNKYAPAKANMVVSFGQQMVMQIIHDAFKKDFFSRSKKEVCGEMKKELSMYLNVDYDVSHFEKLHDLGYLPIHVKIIEEGNLVPIKIPVLTIYNTHTEFYWVTNYLETIISNLLWKPMTSATIAHEYRKVLTKWQDKTDKEKNWFIDWQGHDFSMRGMDSIDATVSSGLGHLTSFLGTDSLPSISGARKYYGETEFVGGSVNATEHSVMCAGGKEDEIETFRRLLNTYPTGILSVVSDTWDLWKVCTEHVVTLKEEILARDGKLVIRPDSGDPVDILCGKQDGILRFTDDYPKNEDLEWENLSHFIYSNYQNNIKGTLVEIGGRLYKLNDCKYIVEEYGWDNGLAVIVDNIRKMLDNGILTEIDKPIENINESRGVIELLWDVFGGTVNEQGYKILDSHIGAIYGDSITIARADEICARLEAKGFASTNVVLGIGSFTYQYNTRDTFGFAMKATYVELTTTIGDSGIGEVGLMDKQVTVGREIFKDPVTDDGTKKSATGLLCVTKHTKNNYMLVDKVSWAAENNGELQTLYKDGEFYNQTTLTKIRKKLKAIV